MTSFSQTFCMREMCQVKYDLMKVKVNGWLINTTITTKNLPIVNEFQRNSKVFRRNILFYYIRVCLHSIEANNKLFLN